MLDGLLKWADPVRVQIRAANSAAGHIVETLMDLSARHVVASRMGATVYRDPTLVEELADPASAQTAALTNVYGDGKASIDLCASALLQWLGIAPAAGRQHSVEALQRRINGGLAISPAQANWFSSVTQSAEGQDLIEFRHASIHRLVRQDAAPGQTPSQTISADLTKPGKLEAADVLDKAAHFVEERWKEFWLALV